MNTQQLTAQEVQHEVIRLLSGTEWDTQVPSSAISDAMWVHTIAHPAEDPAQCHLFLTVVPLAGRARDLADLPVVLAPIDGDTTRLFGFLDGRGQVRFEQLPRGRYRAAVRTRGHQADDARDDTRVGGRLIPIATLPVEWRASAATETRRPLQRFRNSTNTLRTSLRTTLQGRLELDLQSPERAWDGQLVLVGWETKAGRDEHEGTTAYVFVPLDWETRVKSCVGRVPLDALHHDELKALLLPEVSLSPAMLTAADTPILIASVGRTLESSDLAALWQRVLRSTSITDRAGLLQELHQRASRAEPAEQGVILWLLDALGDHGDGGL